MGGDCPAFINRRQHRGSVDVLALWPVPVENRRDDDLGDDELLTNLTIRWATETMGSLIRLYYETVRDPGQWGQAQAPNAMRC